MNKRKCFARSNEIDFSPLFLQRNHTLFGSVWSSMRRKGQAPFGKRGIGSKGKDGNKKLGESTIDEFDYDPMRDVVEGGMNHITKTLMQNRSNGSGMHDVDEYEMANTGNFIGIGGGRSFQPANQQENIPMRPLLMNKNINNNDNNNPNNNMIVDPQNMNQQNLM